MEHAHFDTYAHKAVVESRIDVDGNRAVVVKVGPSWMMLNAIEAAQLAADLVDAIDAKSLEVATLQEVSA